MVLSGNEIREKYIAYFRDKRGHLHLPSASLIPDNPTLLLTSAGMVPFVPIFLGQTAPPSPPRAVTAQKCARAGGKDSDIENVGRTARHHSFFEMMGNFSFGDYFKGEVIPWAWEFVTNDLGLEKDRLSVTIFGGDDELPADEEAFQIWHKKVGLPAQQIIRMSRKDNFWGPPGPTGPCGPCSEIYYDRGIEYNCNTDADKCGIGKCECDRYLEFWNLVFMELFKDETGKFKPLASKNVDTGLGLDRVALILQKKKNTFETDLLYPILEAASKVSGVKYGGNNEQDVALKIITDHARCITFLIADGIRMSNLGRGYVLRFITRRAARFGRLLGLKEPFLYKLVPSVVKIYGGYYQELVAAQPLVETIIKEEEERFTHTIEKGSNFLDELLASSDETLDGKAVFNLYSTYGYPVELTREIAKEKGKVIDMAGFEIARKEHGQVSSVNKFNVNIAADTYLSELSKKSGGTKFIGHDKLEAESEVIGLTTNGKAIEEIAEGEEAEIILDSTPFYAESGGQVGDSGVLENKDVRLRVLDTKKHGDLHVHRVKVESGVIRSGQKITSRVDKDKRQAAMLHHSSAHVFLAAAREYFGKTVLQAGSQVGPQGMRFDFTFDRQPKAAELKQIETMMNEWVRSNSAVETVIMPIEEAKKTGAVAMFGEKYGDIVRVVRMGDFSLEFCGGTHVTNVSQIGLIKIISEGSISSGVRRVEALSGPTAWQYINEQLTYLTDATALLKTSPIELAAQIDRLKEQLKEKERLAQSLQGQLALAKIPSLLEQSKLIGDIWAVVADLSPSSGDDLKTIAQELLKHKPKSIILLASTPEIGKVALACAVDSSLTTRGINAGAIVKTTAAIVGGSGGGRADFAQAGGKYPEKIKEALDAGWQYLLEHSATDKAKNETRQ